MLAGINIVCFTASYAVALALECSRLAFRSGLRGAVMLAFGGAGLLAHTLYLVERARANQTAPLSSGYDWYLVAAWVLAATYLYLTLAHPKASIGLFVLPLVLALIAVGVLWADPQPFALSRAVRLWGMIHGLFLLLGTVAVLVGFVAGLMYLLQASRLKHKRPSGRGVQLPSLEWLERWNSRALFYSGWLFGVGVLSGVVLNLVSHRYDRQTVPWSDPVVLFGLATALWLVVAAGFNLLYQPARQGRKVAYLTVASFCFLVVMLGVSLFSQSQHRGSLRGAPSAALRRPAARVRLADARRSVGAGPWSARRSGGGAL